MGMREGSSGPFVIETSDVAFTSAAVTNATAPDQAVTVPGAQVGDAIQITPLGTWAAGLVGPFGRCLVAGTVQMRIGNLTGAPITPSAQTYRFTLTHDRPGT